MEERFIKHGFNKIKYPVFPCEIPELQNKLQIRINYFYFDDPSGYQRYAMYVFKSDYIEEINLFYWDGQYAWINHFSRLFYDTLKYVFFDDCYVISFLLYDDFF